MARGEINPINRIVPLTEIENWILDTEKNCRVLKGLSFVNLRYQGNGVDEALRLLVSLRSSDTYGTIGGTVRVSTVSYLN